MTNIISTSMKVRAELSGRTAQRRRTNTSRVALAAASGAVPRNDLLPELRIEKLRIEALQAPISRVRKLSTAQITRVCKSLTSFGFVAPVLIDAASKIIDGQIVVEAARQLGLSDVPCVRVAHLSDKDLRLLRLTLNRLGKPVSGTWTSWPRS